MDTGNIKLGAIKRLSRKPRPSVLLEGFFYGGGVCETQGHIKYDQNREDRDTWPIWLKRASRLSATVYSVGSNPARWHLISYILQQGCSHDGVLHTFL